MAGKYEVITPFAQIVFHDGAGVPVWASVAHGPVGNDFSFQERIIQRRE